MGIHAAMPVDTRGVLIVVAVLAGPMATLATRGSHAAPGDGGANPPIVRFGRDIRPLLADRCFKCHGSDKAAREADLRLDDRDSATTPRKDGTPIVAGRPDQSELWKRICSDDPDYQMPPPQSHKSRLGADERDRIRRWIEQGAVYEPHWAFVAPKRPTLPEVRDAKWGRNEVDRFILAELEHQGLAPSPEADKPTLFRRLLLDLTGLPPTPEETDAFLADASPDAFERWVDRIFHEEPYKSRYAERMAAPWLDQARYADTCGIHTDAGRQIWPWRDWVLDAYKENKRFDAFLTEQMAGDLLPSSTMAQKVATGFLRNHVTSDEGGAIAEEYLVEYAVERVATTGSVFLGLTLGCARCHDHKFDPVPQEEFYKLFAFFDSIEEPGLYSQLPNPNRAFEPFIQVPTPAQVDQRERLRAALTKAQTELDAPLPQEESQRKEFFANALAGGGLEWVAPELVRAEAKGGAALTAQPDRSILATGANPPTDEHNYVFRTDANDLRMLSIEALTDPTLHESRVGRAFNGNAVLTGVEVEAVSARDPSVKAKIPLMWAWADHEQLNGDFRAVNVLDAGDRLGWAVQGYDRAGGRGLLVLAEKPFGFAGGTELHVKLQYNSVYSEHTLGRVRIGAAKIAEAGLARAPVAQSDWYLVGPFPMPDKDAAFATAVGPESDGAIDLKKNFGAGNQYWQHQENLADGVVHRLPDGINVTYLGRRVFAPTARKMTLSLGSDDGIRVFVNAKETFSKKIDRPPAPDQDRTEVELRAGMNTIVFKIVNTGGPGGFYYKWLPPDEELSGDLVGALLPNPNNLPDIGERVARAWRMRFSPEYRARTAEIAKLQKEIDTLEGEIPLTMVMKELAAPRETFVLTRGQYDLPDKKRPVTRAVPGALGALDGAAPPDRLALARWLVSAENPLVARVAVNRLFELVFGAGIVRTTEDFGHQGEWPSHPELLDWLAVEFREGGWDVQAILRKLVTSAAYRQSSRLREDAAERDPDNRWLSYFPRKRLGAEQIRDLALWVSGLLVEKLGGPSVKPYQPAGLWEEVAMPASNTRIFQRDAGAALYRRSLYTYWKRASPPPSLMTLDAPTREVCTIRRSSTNTPLQALVLWNDEQFVEAARALAQRALGEPSEGASDAGRIVGMFRRCAGRAPESAELAALTESLATFRARFAAAPEDAKKLIAVGESKAPMALAPPELAAWTLLASSLFSLDATLCKD